MTRVEGRITGSDLELARLAVETGLVPQDRLAACYDDLNADPNLSMAVALVQRGCLNEPQVQALQLEHRKRCPEAYHPDEARQAPQNVFGKYILCKQIGRAVHRAFDTQASRFVAIKFIEASIEPLATLSQLQHPAIAQVYQVGTIDDRNYVAMELVDGVPFDRARLAPSSAIEIGAVVAQALHAAHERGFLHRNIKPTNILVETHQSPIPGSGLLLAVYVTDFGIPPREVNPYFAPEGPMLATSDIYSLGAVLYQALTSSPPGRTPPSELNPNLDGSVDRVLLKALAEDPRRRYATGREFAEDLKRCLRGEPVQAPPTRKLSPALAVKLLFAALLTILAAAVGYELINRNTYEEEIRDSRQQNQQAKATRDARAKAEATRLAEAERATDPKEARKLCEELLASDPIDRAPVHAMLARIEMRCGNYDAARSALEEAARLRPTSTVLLDLGRVNLTLSRGRSIRAEYASTRERVSLLREADRFRTAALTALLACVREGGDPSLTARAEALEALSARDAAQAIAISERLLQTSPHDPELLKIQGEAYQIRKEADRARDAYRHAFELFSGDTEARTKFGQASLVKAEELVQEAHDPSKELDEAIDAFETVTRLRADDPAGWYFLGSAHKRKVEYLVSIGQNPSSEVQAGTAAFHRVPGGAALLSIAELALRKIQYLRDVGQDPNSLIGEAISAADQAVAGDPDNAEARGVKGRICLHAQDVDAAIEAFETMRRLAGASTEAYAGLAEAWMQRGMKTASEDAYDAAVRIVDEGLKIRADYRLEYASGMVRHARAAFKFHRNEGGDADVQEAISSLERAIALNRYYAPSYFLMGDVYVTRGLALESVGLEAGSCFAGAIAVIEEALQLAPRLAQAHWVVGEVQQAKALWLKRRGKDARASLEAAIAAYRRAAELSEDHAPRAKDAIEKLKKELGAP